MPINRRTLDGTSGSALIQTKLAAELIPSLVPNSAVIANGARIAPINKAGTVNYPCIESGATVSVTADGSIPTAGDPTFSLCTLVPFTVAANIKMSRTLMNTNIFGAALEGALAVDLQRRAFAELDRVILNGSGTGDEPYGILNNSDVTLYSAGTDGAAVSQTQLTDMEFDLGAQYSGGELAWFTNAAMRRACRKKATAAGVSPLWTSTNRLLGWDTNVTEHIPSDLIKGAGTNLSGAILGDWSQVIVGLWAPAFEVVLNPYSNNGTVSLTVFLYTGFGLLRNEAFVRCLDFIA